MSILTRTLLAACALTLLFACEERPEDVRATSVPAASGAAQAASDAAPSTPEVYAAPDAVKTPGASLAPEAPEAPPSAWGIDDDEIIETLALPVQLVSGAMPSMEQAMPELVGSWGD